MWEAKRDTWSLLKNSASNEIVPFIEIVKSTSVFFKFFLG